MALETDHTMRGGPPADQRVLTARGLRTRASLVAAARTVFEGTLFDHVRVADITARAQVSTGTFYNYFDSKEEVFREVAEEVLAEMRAAGRLDPEGTDVDPIDAIAGATRRFYHVLLRNAGVARSIEHLSPHDEHISRALRNSAIESVNQIHDWIRRLQRRGIGDPEIDAWTVAMVLNTMSVRVGYDHLLASGDEGQIDKLVDVVTHVAARAVGIDRPVRSR